MKVGACISLFVSLVYCAESTVRWFVVREKYCWMAADSADKSKRTGRGAKNPRSRVDIDEFFNQQGCIS
jgi:hypothetical protein